MAAGSERSADPKERLKEEKDCIVLSPQRRSFGTGCHVSHQQPLLQRAISNIEAERDRWGGALYVLEVTLTVNIDYTRLFEW